MSIGSASGPGTISNHIDFSQATDRWQLMGALALLPFALVAGVIWLSAIVDLTLGREPGVTNLIVAPLLACAFIWVVWLRLRSALTVDELIFSADAVVHARKILLWKQVRHFKKSEIDWVSWKTEAIDTDPGSISRGVLMLSYRGEVFRLVSDPLPGDVRSALDNFSAMGMPQK